ncbi:glycoside hydrolase family 88 protein [Flavobacterium sp. WC2509]|uniref:glycoside hydrolase family 88 protein n=1 Tax=Flavobacterium sp. WC2509 TaxID=3461406 RepID=UPI0040440683
MKKIIADNFKLAVKQYQLLEKNTPLDSMPKTFEKNRNKNSDIYWWTSGFFTGSLLYIYEYTKNPVILSDAKKRLALLKPVQNYTENHDLGFMMYCSYGNAYRLFKDPAYKDIIIQSSKSLVTRYRPNAKVIQSWNVDEIMKKHGLIGPVIIDNMMNLEMLEWASQNSADKSFADIARNHANTTLKNHFRADNSSYHVVDYNLNTGEIHKKVTNQGTADESAWSRGQAWGLYGYTMMYRFTKDKRYLDQAQKIEKFIFTNPNMPSDLVPYWDFNAPGIPNAYRDASSAAINASALLELAQYVGKEQSNTYVKTAEKIIRSLSSATYLAKPGENGGYLLMHNVGNIPAHSEIDTTLTYADYYFLEALLRYKKWYL